MAGGTASAVLDGQTGLRVDGENIEQITASLDKLLTDEIFAKQLGEQGYHRALSDFSWEAVAEKTDLLQV